MFEKITHLITPILLICISLIMRFSKNERYFGHIIRYKKKWMLFFILGLFILLSRIFLK
jgi:hypothetical protein